MNNFKEITDRLKYLINITRDKELVTALGIKPTTFASMKHRNKIPYVAILTYCRDNLIDSNVILLGKITLDEPVAPEIEGKVTIRYFRSLDDYELCLRRSEEVI